METLELTKPKARGKKRKTSPRPQRWTATRLRPRATKPGSSAAQKALWADPVYRAMMMEKRKAAGEKMRGQPGRHGVPDGMRKPQAMALIEIAKESAKETMADLKTAGVLDGADPRAEEALEKALIVMRSPGDKKVTLAAASLVLTYTKAKPAIKSDITVNKAEEWLKAVAAEDDSDEGKTPTDA